MEGYYGYGAEQYYGGAGWPWQPSWDDGTNWAATGVPSGTTPPVTADMGLGAGTMPAAQIAPEVQEESAEAQVQVADTPKPEARHNSCAETPSTASGGGKDTVERTPATTAGRSSDLQSPVEEYDADEQEQQTPVNMRLFAPGSASDTGAAGGGKTTTPMRVEVPLSALLDGPPG